MIKSPSRYAKFAFAHALSIAEATCDVGEPTSFSEVVSSQKSTEWLITMNEEMESLHKNQTWVLVAPPKGQKVISCKWIFKRKEGILGVADVRYKTRLVAKGFS